MPDKKKFHHHSHEPVEKGEEDGVVFKNEVDTMQDDLAGLIEKKNNKKIGFFKHKLTSGKKDIQKNLVEVYTNGNGEIPDLTKLERTQRPLWKTITYSLIAVLFVLLVMAGVGFWMFNNLSGNTSFTNKNVILKIEPPLSVVSGQEGLYKLTIINNEKTDLYDLKLAATYPDNFQFVSSSPKAMGENKNAWNFSVLKSGETQVVEISGILTDSINTTKTFKANMSYKPASVNASYQQEAYADALISSSTVGLTVTGPDKIMANQSAEYTLFISNTGSSTLNNLQVIVQYPSGFTFASSSPTPDSGGNNIWTIARLDSLSTSTNSTSSETKIKISGNYGSILDSGNQAFSAKVNLNNNGDYYLQNEQALATTVAKDQLNLQLVVNGSGEDQSINFGDLLIYSLGFKNTGQSELSNVQIKANLDSQIIDWTTYQGDGGGTVSGNSVTWTGKQIPQLLKIAPGAEGTINWQVRVKDSSVVVDKSVSKFSVESFVEAFGKSATSTSLGSLGKTKVITNSINSDIGLTASARYYNEDNIALGSGNIAPKADEESGYNVKFELINNLHDMANIQVSAVLPKNVTWAGKENHNTGDVIYNAKTRKLLWTISKLPKSAQNTAVDFNLNITPTINDIGKVLILIPQVDLTAIDLTTGANVSKSVKAITTAFKDPIMGDLNGIVQ
ncbi:MAG: hypothetical protein WC244_00050 [Patescibacteria group bacterium]|jgi:uncharacterized repeat protein (TIGR01451 family)